MEKIEVTGKTVEEALINAALQLETSSDNLEYEVIEKGSNGLFGFINSKPAKILVSKKQEENAEIIEEITVEETEEVKPEKVVDKGAVEDKIRKFLNDKRILTNGTRRKETEISICTEDSSSFFSS